MNYTGMDNVKRFYIPFSKERGEPYYDGDGKTYILASADDVGDALLEQKLSTRSDIYSLCYAIGVTEIEDHVFENVKTIKLTDRNRYVKKDYYNNRLNRDITKLLETKEKRYLYDLKECKFLIAAKVKEGNKLSYAVAKDKNDPEKYFYIAFSTHNEFLLWRENGSWKLVEADFNTLTRISREHPYVINPCGRRLILTPSLMEQISKGDKT